MDNQPQQTPLIDHLRSVPANYRAQWEIQWAEDGTATGHAMSPLGRHAHEAADTIESLQRERDALESWLLDIVKSAGRGVPDCIDNDGQPYQSQSFLDWIDSQEVQPNERSK